MSVGPFIVSVDCEAAVRDALLASLPLLGEDVKVCVRIPATRPAEFLHILLAGGPRETLVTDAFRVIVEAWAQDEPRAAELLNRARAILFAQQGPTLFGVVEYAGPANLPDPTSDQVRYTASMTVRARATQTA